MKKQFLLIATIFAALLAGSSAFAGTPTINVSFTPTSYTGSNWVNSDVAGTVTCTPSDASSTCSVFTCIDTTDTCAPVNQNATTYTATVSSEGTSYLRYYVGDGSGNNTTQAKAVIKIDKTQPATASITAPANLSTISGTYSFVFDSTDAAAGILKTELFYSLNGSTKLGESASGNYSVNTASLTNGTYSFWSVVTDNAGNTRQSNNVVATINNVSTANPVLATVTAVPTYTNSLTPSFTFSSDKAGTLTYTGDCSSATTNAVAGNNTVSFTVGGIQQGAHSNCTIKLTAADNGSTTLAVPSFTLDTVAPTAVTFTNAPTAGSNTAQTSWTITVGGTDVNYYKYQLDSGSVSSEFAVGTSLSLSGLSLGSHTLTVYGKDNAGNWQTTPTTLSWTNIQSTAPTATLSGKPSDPTTLKTTDITVGGTNVTHYKYKLDTGSWSAEKAVSVHIQLTGLTEGMHDLYVIGRNADGAWQATTDATSYTWEVDDDATTATTTTVKDNSKKLVKGYVFRRPFCEKDGTKTEIQELQRRMKKLGFYQKDESGVWNTYLTNAVKSYQTEYRLKQSGCVDDSTMEKLNKSTPMIEVKMVSLYQFKKYLCKGDTHPEVAELRKRLIREGFYNGTSTDSQIFDARLENALFSWQLENNVRRTKCTDMDTIDKLTATGWIPATDAPAATTPTEADYIYTKMLWIGHKGDDIKKLQLRLLREKLMAGSATGIFDKLTQDGVKRFQIKYKLTMNGYLDNATIQMLNKLAYKPATTATTTTPATPKPATDPNALLQMILKMLGIK